MKKKFLLQAISMISIIASKLGGQVIFFIIIANKLTPNEFGKFATIFAAAIISTIPIDFGQTNSTLHAIGKEPENAPKILLNKIKTKLFMTAIVFFPAILLSNKILENNFSILFTILMLSSIIQSYSELFGCALRAIEKYAVESFASTILTVILLVVTKTSTSDSVLYFSLVFLTYKFIIFATIAIYSAKEIGFEKNSGTKYSFFESLKNEYNFALDQCITTLTNNLDTLILSAYASPSLVANYQIAQKIATGYNSTALVVSNILLPKLSRSYGNNIKNHARQKNASKKIFFCLGAIGLIIFYSSSKYISDTIYNGAYKELEAIVPIFGVLVFIKFISASLGVTIISQNLQAEKLRINILSLFIFFIASAALTPKFNINGIMISQIVSSIFVIGMYKRLINQKGG